MGTTSHPIFSQKLEPRLEWRGQKWEEKPCTFVCGVIYIYRERLVMSFMVNGDNSIQRLLRQNKRTSSPSLASLPPPTIYGPKGTIQVGRVFSSHKTTASSHHPKFKTKWVHRSFMNNQKYEWVVDTMDHLEETSIWRREGKMNALWATTWAQRVHCSSTVNIHERAQKG